MPSIFKRGKGNWRLKYKIHSSVDGDDVATALFLTAVAVVAVIAFTLWRLL